MPHRTWRPGSEMQAVSAQVVFLEWLSAVRGVTLAGPPALAEWRSGAPAAFDAAIVDFVGLHGYAGARDALLRGQGTRPAFLLCTADGGRQAWSRADLLGMKELPEPTDKMLTALMPRDLPALAASHLLDAGTAPDDCLLWTGDPADPWPLGAWLSGAAIAITCAAETANFEEAISVSPRWRR